MNERGYNSNVVKSNEAESSGTASPSRHLLMRTSGVMGVPFLPTSGRLNFPKFFTVNLASTHEEKAEHQPP